MDHTEGCESVIRTVACVKLVCPVSCGFATIERNISQRLKHSIFAPEEEKFRLTTKKKM